MKLVLIVTFVLCQLDLTTAQMDMQGNMEGMVDPDGHLNHTHVYDGNIQLIGSGQDQSLGYTLDWNTYAKDVQRAMPQRFPERGRPPRNQTVRELHQNVVFQTFQMKSGSKVTFGAQFRPLWADQRDSNMQNGRNLQRGNRPYNSYRPERPPRGQDTYWDGFMVQFDYDYNNLDNIQMTIQDLWSAQQATVGGQDKNGRLQNLQIDSKDINRQDKNVSNWVLNPAKSSINCTDDGGAICIINAHFKRDFFTGDGQDWQFFPYDPKNLTAVGFYQVDSGDSSVTSYVAPKVLLSLFASTLITSTAGIVAIFTQLL